MFYLGVDVAKAKLDCLLLDAATQKRKSKTVANSIEGVAALLKSLQTWGIDPKQLNVLIEPTGSYHELAAFALADAGCSVCLVNPAQLRFFVGGSFHRDRRNGFGCGARRRGRRSGRRFGGRRRWFFSGRWRRLRKTRKRQREKDRAGGTGEKLAGQKVH